MFDVMGADVKLKRYEHRAHTIISDELEVVHQMLHDAFFALRWVSKPATAVFGSPTGDASEFAAGWE